MAHAKGTHEDNLSEELFSKMLIRLMKSIRSE